MTDWTHDRIATLWIDLAVLRGERPVSLLRRRFRQTLDAASLGDEAAQSLAAVFVLWGVLQVREAWVKAAPDRQAGLHEARSIFADAGELGRQGPVVAMALLNSGLVDLLRALSPNPDQALAIQVGQVTSDYALQHGLSTSSVRNEALQGACKSLAVSSCADAEVLLGLASMLLGCAGKHLPVRNRLALLRRGGLGPGPCGNDR